MYASTRDSAAPVFVNSVLQDGLSYPFLWLPLYLTLEDRTGSALKDFFTVAILYQVVLGVALGSALGFFFAHSMKVMEKRRYIGRDSYAIQFIFLSLFTIGAVSLIGSDDLLAAFAAGKAQGTN